MVSLHTWQSWQGCSSLSLSTRGIMHRTVQQRCCHLCSLELFVDLLQNASLTVMTEGSIWSMTSSDSLWGDTEDLPQEESPAAEGKTPPETWMLLEFCDRGSLLVSRTVTAYHAVACQSKLLVRQPFHSSLHCMIPFYAVHAYWS